MPPAFSKTQLLNNGDHSPPHAEESTISSGPQAPAQPDDDYAIEDGQGDYEAGEEEEEEEGNACGFKNLAALPQYLSQPRNIQALLSM